MTRNSLGANIAGLSLGSVREAAAALQGTSRAYPALQKAFEHTPNVWVDSPQLMHTKLKEIQTALQNMVTEQRRGGLDVGGDPVTDFLMDPALNRPNKPNQAK